MNSEKPTLEELRIHRRPASDRRWGGWLVLVVVASLGLIAALAWWLNRPKAAAVRTVIAQKAVTGGQRTLLNGSGYVTARRQATVSSKVTGKVVEVLVEEGMKVEAGQVLARVDSSNIEKSLHLSQAQLEAARRGLDETRANLERAERELRRSEQLAADRVASQSVLDQAEADAKALRARLAKQEADVVVSEREVALWQQQLDDTIIRSPFAGIVTSKNAQPGEMISPISAGGGFTRTGICTLVDMSSLEIEVDVNESFINRVEPGQRVQATLDAYPDWRIPAKVIAIIPAADRQKATVRVRVGLDTMDSRILPDMGVKVAFQSVEGGQPVSEGVSVPKAAVQQREGRSVVWVVDQDRAERRAVTVGTVQNGEAIVLGGLQGGERVVIEGPGNLVDGVRVKENKP